MNNTYTAQAFIVLLTLVFAPIGLSQESPVPEASERSDLSKMLDRVKFSGYGTFNYNRYRWESFPDLKDDFAFERLILKAKIDLAPKLEVVTEIEIEGGGTGSALEFERREEFGEFEFESEAGGEILVEEFYIKWSAYDWLDLKVGQIIAYVGPTNKRHRPFDYLTNPRPESETNVIPVTWSTPGITAQGSVKNVITSDDEFQYQVAITQSLDSTNFSSERFVADGINRKFENSVMEDFGVSAFGEYTSRFDGGSWHLGFSGFWGDTSGNRQRNDIEDEAYLVVASGHGGVSYRGALFRAHVLWASLQNSDIVTDANKNLSNAIQAPRTPVGKVALSYSIELGYDVFDSLYPKEDFSLTPWVRYEFYDTQHETHVTIFDNPRFEREAFFVGINAGFYDKVVGKASFMQRDLGSGETEETYAFGVGVQF